MVVRQTLCPMLGEEVVVPVEGRNSTSAESDTKECVTVLSGDQQQTAKKITIRPARCCS